jgi:pilus assembly protein CpaF
VSDNNSNNSFLVLFLGPVSEHFADDDMSEILINGPGQINVERRGRLKYTDAIFASEPALKAAAVNIAKSVGRLLNEDNPLVDARLPDGSRVHAVTPPPWRDAER